MPALLLFYRLCRALPGLLGVILLSATAWAQAPPDPIKYGQIDKADLTAAPFRGDSAAAAVVLCDYGRSRLRGKRDGLEVVFERITRIKILKKAGYEEATVEIPLYHRDGDSEKVSSLRGVTYNLVNGVVEKTTLEASGAFIEKRTANLNVQKFTLPNVREGSVIEYSYILASDYLFNFQDWDFQRAISVRWSEYRSSIPTFYKYNIIYQGTRPLDVNVLSTGSVSLVLDNKLSSSAGIGAGLSAGNITLSATTENHRWVLKNVPAFRPEPYMTTARDYTARLDFELTGEQWPEQPYQDLTGSWEKINARLLASEGFGGRIGRVGFLQDQLQGLPAQYPDLRARAAAVRQVVMAAVRYNGQNRLYAPEPLRKAFDAHRGTSADVNLLLLAALEQAGIKAHPLLLSTRDHGRVSQEYPLLERFNYVVALVPVPGEKDLLVDATAPVLPCGVLPERCLNRVGRLVSKVPAEGRWVDLAPAQRHVHYQQIDMALDAQGGLTGKVHEEYGGYAAADARGEIASQGEKKYLAGLQQRHENWTLPTMTVNQAEAVDKPLSLDYAFSQAGAEQPAPGPLYLSPLSEFGPGQNPFRHEDRAFAVDFGAPQEETLVLNLMLPAGYELAETPKPAVVSLPNDTGRFRYSVSTAQPGVVQLVSRLTLSNAVYPAEEYASLRELYRLLLQKQGEKLIIRKKPGG
ncbi:DUF3857 domain-containing protein [Hymenobacter sp. IS2118]|uniref:DUF3857 domain-containing protein n=1 Tax=Hymenobacter sp. IS2118 TaxID=1505605 RepID=UPI000555A421|nr:DUF3857 domain-containing protein [Hymenobacter sp. IS2118]